jgi:hypothetical protein
MRRWPLEVLVIILLGLSAHAQTNAFGKVIWPLGKSPGYIAGDITIGLAGTWWNPMDVGGVTIAPIARNYTTGSTRQVQIVKKGSVMTVTDNGSLQFAVTNSLISQISGFGFGSWEAGNEFWVDDFSVGNFTDDFSATNSGNWTHSIEMEPVGPHRAPPGNITQALWNSCVQASYSRVQGGRLELKANTQSGMDFGKTYAKFNRPISGDFTMQFTFAKTQWAGHTHFKFTTTPGGPGGGASRPRGKSYIILTPASVVRIQRRLNPNTGQMQLVAPPRFLTHRGVFSVAKHNQYGKKRLWLRSQRTRR